MKKYIAPVIKNINLYSEASFLTGSKDPEDTIIDSGSDGEQLSNRRDGSIWDNAEF